MSASQTPPGPASGPATAAPAGGTPSDSDPSMEDILASIRRILSEDEPAPTDDPAGPPPSPAGTEKAEDGVLVLDPAMMVPEAPEPSEIAEPVVAPTLPASTGASLVAPEAAAAAASSVGSLMRTLTAERGMQLRSGGPTIEDLVREELRVLLKTWLDANLPGVVERLVRAEIERVVARAAP